VNCLASDPASRCSTTALKNVRAPSPSSSRVAKRVTAARCVNAVRSPNGICSVSPAAVFPHPCLETAATSTVSWRSVYVPSSESAP
jgi:hypothetical protein